MLGGGGYGPIRFLDTFDLDQTLGGKVSWIWIFFLLEREREVVKGVKGFFVIQGYIYFVCGNQ